MDILKTGIGISRTIRNAARLKEILSVFAKNGFNELVIKLQVANVLPRFVIPKNIGKSLNFEKRGENFWGVLGFRLRLSFEELGPSFIKLGQLLSTREDLFDMNFIEQMKKLHGDTKAMDFSLVKEAIEKSPLGVMSEAFKEFDQEPIGTASIGGVYRGVLLNGEQVVVKVRKPGLAKMIQGDFEILDWIIMQLEKIGDDIKVLGLRDMLVEFHHSLNRELNFYQEAISAKKIQKGLDHFKGEHFLVIPKVYDEYTCEDILVMEYMDGVPFNKIYSVNDLGEDGEKKLITSVKAFIYSLLREGFFHADLHGGNFFSLKNGKIGIIDFGLMGSLSQKDRISLVVILSSMVEEKFDRLAGEFLDISDYDKMPDEKKLASDIRDALAPYLGLTVQQTDIQALFRGIFKVLTLHRITLPTEWFLIFRSIIMLDGVAQSLKVDLDFNKLLMEDIDKLGAVMLDLDDLKTEALWLGRDAISTAKIFPRHIRRFVKHLEKRGYRFELELTGVEQSLGRLAGAIEFFACMALFGIFISLAAEAGLYLEKFTEMSVDALVFLLLALVSLLVGIKRLSLLKK